MGDAPTVSVVMPAHNGARWVGEAIDSVLAQDGVDLELVIADHASTDETPQILERYASDPRVRLIDVAEGGGAARAWNAVTRAARGRYVKLVCHDDSLLPGVLARQVHLLDSHPGAAMTACRRNVIDDDGRVRVADWGLQGLGATEISGSGAVDRAVRTGINPFGEPACVLTSRALLEQVGLWDGRRPYVLDLSTYFRLLKHGSFVPDSATGANFRVNRDQLSFHLRDSQARQVTELHQEVLRDTPAWRQLPLRLSGKVLAHGAAFARRLVYRRAAHGSGAARP